MRSQAVRWRIAQRHLQPQPHHRLRWVLGMILALALLAGGATAAAAMVFVSQLPSVSRFHIRYPFQDARIYDSRGDLLYDMADLNQKAGLRIVEPLQARTDTRSACRGGVDRIPVILQNATISTEDATFYTNPGFDILSIARAAYDDLHSGHIVSGASTITQQLVRANMLSDAQTFSRKANEVALAYEITKRFSKRTLLKYYLNSVSYGNLAYGARAAAQVYFGEPVCKLDLAQAALLAGMPRDPTYYDPVLHRAAAMTRMRTVLHLMYIHHNIRRKSWIAAALREAQRWQFFQAQPTMRYPAFTRYAIGQFQSMPQLRNQIYGGIDVYTTLDPRLQNLAQGLVTNQINGLVPEHVTDGALVSLDVRPQHYGWILAMVGTANPTGSAGQVNMAIQPRQPGSSMKPFNYVWAFAHGGVGPGTYITDSPIALPDPGDLEDDGWFTPLDYDLQWHGTVTLRQALDNSLNVPAIKVEYYVTGIKNVAQTARDFGMTHLYADNPNLTCSMCYALTIGGLARGTRLLEETAAYGVFATSGVTVPPVAIWKVVQRSTGKVLFCSDDCPKGVPPDPQLLKARKRVASPAHAYEITSILSDNNSRCTPQVCEFGLNSPLLLDRPAAAKTGTTNAWSDNWTEGFTPQIVTGVWVGNADRTPMIGVNGVTGAAPVWHDFMEGAFRVLRLPVEGFVQPPGVIHTNRCFAGNGISLTNTDIYVPGPGRAALPSCAIAERGYAPVPCIDDPSVITPQCAPGTGYRYTYTYGFGASSTTFPTSPSTNTYPSAPQQPLQQATSPP